MTTDLSMAILTTNTGGRLDSLLLDSGSRYWTHVQIIWKLHLGFDERGSDGSAQDEHLFLALHPNSTIIQDSHMTSIGISLDVLSISHFNTRCGALHASFS